MNKVISEKSFFSEKYDIKEVREWIENAIDKGATHVRYCKSFGNNGDDYSYLESFRILSENERLQKEIERQELILTELKNRLHESK